MTRRLRSSLLLFVLAMALSGASAVEAQVTPPSDADTQDAAAHDAEAHSLFEAGRTAYGEGRFEAALGHFTQAFELSGRPALLYNIGQCRDRLRRDADAVTAFEAFLAALPEAPQRAEVTARLEILRAAIERETATTASATTTTTTTTTAPATTTDGPPAPTAGNPAPWIVLGVGGAVAVVGAILLAVGFSNLATVDAATNVRFATVRGAYEDAPVLTGAGWAALGVGAALAGVGLVWGLTSGGGSSAEHARLRIGPTGVSLTGSF